MPNRLKDKDISVYLPTNDELILVEKFVKWNTLSHGIQRIDFIRTKDKGLLLTEVEDISPYLYINDVDSKTKQLFLDNIKSSVTNFFS